MEIGPSVPVNRPSDHLTEAESAAKAAREKWYVGSGWRHAHTLTMFVRLGEESQRSGFEGLATPLFARPKPHSGSYAASFRQQALSRVSTNT